MGVTGAPYLSYCFDVGYWVVRVDRFDYGFAWKDEGLKKKT
jgi:hypothetical protein